MDYKKSFEELEKNLSELKEKNLNIPIIVEGEKDIVALNKIGINGTIISINKGMSLITFCDWIANHYQEIIILTDWDRKGGYLCRILVNNLEGRVKYDIKFRELLARYITIRTVEGLPSWIETMKNKINHF